MFSFFESFKYRSEVLVGVHSILFMVPALKAVLNTFPSRNKGIKEFKKSQTPPLEAAVYVSMVVLEKLMDAAPLQTRSVVLQQLEEKSDDAFRWFAHVGEGIKNGTLPYPEGTIPLTMVLGFAMWYLGFAERDGKLSAQAHKTFLADVGGMLRGRSSEERARLRLQVALGDIIGEAEES
jgi:hypothetical protein